MTGNICPGRRLLGNSGVAVLVIGVLATLVYGGHLQNPLVFDSVRWFSEQNLRTLRDLSTSDRYLSKKLTYWLYQLLGGRMDLFRAVHLSLHVSTAYVLFLFFRRLMPLALAGPRSALVGSGFGPALAVAVLFTLHPVQVYAVADPGQMELVLATLFGVLMLGTYLEALLRSSRVLLVLSALFYLLAVLSKENVVTMPAVAVALTLLVRRPSWALARQIWPWYCLVGLIALWVVAAEVGQHRESPGLDTIWATSGAEPGGRSFDGKHLYLRSAVTQGYLFFRHWLLWLVPHVGWMSLDLQYPLAPRLGAWPESAGFAAFCLYPIAAGWLLLRGGRAGLVGFGLLWPWLLFLPELATTRITEAFVLYRGYLWIGGMLAALVASLAPLLGRAAGPLLCVLCVALGGLAHERLVTFRSAYTVWDDAVRKNQPYERYAIGAYRPYLNRGGALLDLGDTGAALSDFATALALRPGLPHAHFNRGLAYIRLGRYQEALAAFNEGMASSGGIRPSARARAHSHRADLYLLLGRPRDALADLIEAAALDPDRAEYRINLERLRRQTRE